MKRVNKEGLFCVSATQHYAGDKTHNAQVKNTYVQLRASVPTQISLAEQNGTTEFFILIRTAGIGANRMQPGH